MLIIIKLVNFIRIYFLVDLCFQFANNMLISLKFKLKSWIKLSLELFKYYNWMFH